MSETIKDSAKEALQAVRGLLEDDTVTQNVQALHVLCGAELALERIDNERGGNISKLRNLHPEGRHLMEEARKARKAQGKPASDADILLVDAEQLIPLLAQQWANAGMSDASRKAEYIGGLLRYIIEEREKEALQR